MQVARALPLLLALGCRTPPEELGVDAARPVLDATRGDTGPVDARCTFALRPVALGSIEPVDAFPRLRGAIRVRIFYGRSGCERPGPIEVAVRPGNAIDDVTITAHVWHLEGNDCPFITPVTRVVVLSDTPGLSSASVVVRDGAPGGIASLTLDVAPSAGDACGPKVGIDGACQRDCQCANPGTRCIPTDVRSGFCAYSCSEDADCRTPFDLFPRCGTSQRAPAICGKGACADGGCPPNQGCVAVDSTQRACRPTERAGSAPPCHCNSDCRAGRICRAPEFDCILPCVTDRDCLDPGAEICDNGACRIR